MRQIKFRGKRIDSLEWVYGYLGQTHMGKMCIQEIQPEPMEGIINWQWFEVLLETVGQFTCLKDKNRKEIYEGDIVEGNPGFIHLVEFKEGCFVWDNWPLNFDPENGEKCNTEVWATVIGNIYENTELLKG